jgi:uridine phosphorylase
MLMKKYFFPSELLINDDSSVFHLHIKPEQLADKVVLVGDPGRVATVGSHFECIESEVENREFKSFIGIYKGKRITVLSTGIGCDNIDIVLNELDALANIDFNTRTEKENFRCLEFVRIGTCGGLQLNTPIGTFICSQKSIGFDGLLNFYAGRREVCDMEFEKVFLNYMGWTDGLCTSAPYVVDADKELVRRIARNDMILGVTVAANGFFGPQGRELRVPLADPKQNEKIETFEYNGYKITNYEMESSALAGLSKLMGHKAVTVCMVVANRFVKEADTAYRKTIDTLIQTVLDRI